MKILITHLCLAFVLLFLRIPAQAAGVDKFLALGSSSASGVYYPVALAISNRLNRGRLVHGIRATTCNTGGSVYNIQALSSGELDLAITRSDLAYDAYNGLGLFESIGPNHEFRIITTLYEMPVAIIVRNDSGITELSQIKGMRVNRGNLGSGKRTMADLLFRNMGWGGEDFSEVAELSSRKAGEAFCNGDIDVVIEAMGVPNQYYDRLANECGGRFLAVPAGPLNTIVAGNPFFKKGAVSGGVYPHNPQAVPTFIADVVLITSSRVHPQSIYHVTGAIFDDLQGFKAQHPALTRSTVESMIMGKPFVPFHRGAERYFRQNRLW